MRQERSRWQQQDVGIGDSESIVGSVHYTYLGEHIL